jgi:hypothetical protein
MATSFSIDRMKSVAGLAPAAHTATTEVDAAAVDRTGFNTLFVLVDAGISTGNTLTLKAYDGATSSPVTAVTFNATPAVITNTAATQTFYQIDLSGFNKYFKISITPSTATSVIFGVEYLLADASIDPASGTAVTPLAKA